jgi:transposase
LIDWVKTECGWELTVTKRSEKAKGFVVVPKRWVVETCQADPTSSDRWCDAIGAGYDPSRCAA